MEYSEEEGIKATLVNARFIKPLDENLLLDLAGKSSKILTVEENTIIGGFGSAVRDLLVDSNVQIICIQ